MQLAIPIFLKLDSFRCLSYVNKFQLLHIFFSFSDCNYFFLNQWLRFVCLFFFHVSVFLRTLTCTSFSPWGSSGCHGLVLALPSHLKPQLKEELGQSSCCCLLVGLSSVSLLCGLPTTAGVFSQSTPGGADAQTQPRSPDKLTQGVMSQSMCHVAFVWRAAEFIQFSQ